MTFDLNTIYADGDWETFLSKAEYYSRGGGEIPLLELFGDCQIRISEVKARRFYIVDRAQIKAKEEIEGKNVS
jgi:hypothetical protein